METLEDETMKLDNCNTWSVAITHPKNDAMGRRWAHNDTVTVVATSMLEAHAEVLKEWPDVKIWSINHIGSKTVLLMAGLDMKRET